MRSVASNTICLISVRTPWLMKINAWTQHVGP